MAEGCAALLRTHGYQATANTEEHLPTGAEDRSPLPHKAVACRAGLGWIGKNNLLTTPDFGGAVRLCTVVTDAPLAYGGAHSLQPLRQLPSVRGCLSLLRSVRHPVAHGLDGTICSTTCCANAPPRSERDALLVSPLPSAANASPCVPTPSDI